MPNDTFPKGIVGYKLGCLLAVTHQLWVTAGLNPNYQSLHLQSAEFTKMVLLDENTGRTVPYIYVSCVLLCSPWKKFRHEKCVEITETTGCFMWAENRAALLHLCKRQSSWVSSGCEQMQHLTKSGTSIPCLTEQSDFSTYKLMALEPLSFL